MVKDLELRKVVISTISMTNVTKGRHRTLSSTKLDWRIRKRILLIALKTLNELFWSSFITLLKGKVYLNCYAMDIMQTGSNNKLKCKLNILNLYFEITITRSCWASMLEAHKNYRTLQHSLSCARRLNYTQWSTFYNILNARHFQMCTVSHSFPHTNFAYYL